MEGPTRKQPEVDHVVAFLLKHEKGFDALENGLRNTLVEGLTSSVDSNASWWYIRKHLGIYAISGRVKSEDRFRTKLVEGGPEVQCVPGFVEYMPDIVGVRVICLHPDDLYGVSETVRVLLNETGIFTSVPEQLQAKERRVRRGNFSMLSMEDFKRQDYVIEEPHRAGYSSIHLLAQVDEGFVGRIDMPQRDHYKKLSRALKGKRCVVEVQVRTILEEAWGEVDHWIRYENEKLREDEDLEDQFSALAAYIQAGNHHISAIRRVAARKRAIDDAG